MKNKTVIKSVVAVVLIGGSMVYFVSQAMQTSWAYYYSVDEFAERMGTAQNQSVRLAGRVGKDSVERDLQKMNVKFTLAGSEKSLPIDYTGVVPDNFADEIEVVVEGRLADSGVFEANKLMTKCESKYKAKVE
jgi:cytochrome c-type biogenesis protein CcmE